MVPLPPTPLIPPPWLVGDIVGVGEDLEDLEGVVVGQGEVERVRLVKGELEGEEEREGVAVVEGEVVEDWVRKDVGVNFMGEGVVVRVTPPQGGLGVAVGEMEGEEDVDGEVEEERVMEEEGVVEGEPLKLLLPDPLFVGVGEEEAKGVVVVE